MSIRNRESLDIYDRKPEGMIAYLRNNGWHFSKRMCEWAISQMRKRVSGTDRISKIDMVNKDQVNELLKKYAVELEFDNGYDSVYVANMCKADFLGSSIIDERHMALFVRDMVDDIDQQDGFIFSRFYSDCVRKGVSIPWEDVL